MKEMNPLRFAHDWNNGIMGSGQLGKWFNKISQSGSAFHYSIIPLSQVQSSNICFQNI
jgi:hypothetical protein